MASKILFPDLQGPNVTRGFHRGAYLLAGLVPATVVLPTESVPAKATDAALSVLIPVHGYVGMTYVVSDYLPKPAQLPIRVGLLGFSAVAAAGLFKLTFSGAGIGGSLKQLWTKPQKA